MKRLDFALPAFFRHTWVSDQAKNVWGPRVFRVRQVWQVLEVASVREGLRDCCLVPTPPEGLEGLKERAARNGLLLIELASPAFRFRGESSAENGSFVVMGSAESAERFAQAWESESHVRMGRLLGYPVCCCEFYHKLCVELEFRDTIWHMAKNTENASNVRDDVCREFENEARTNVLLHRMGIKPVLHLPCAFDCQETIQWADSFSQLGRENGFETEMDFLAEMLSWPVQWTALHGIGEIKTPVLKASTDTDATPDKYTVRLFSASFPQQGLRGPAFPYGPSQINRGVV